MTNADDDTGGVSKNSDGSYSKTVTLTQTPAGWANTELADSLEAAGIDLDELCGLDRLRSVTLGERARAMWLACASGRYRTSRAPPQGAPPPSSRSQGAMSAVF